MYIYSYTACLLRADAWVFLYACIIMWLVIVSSSMHAETILLSGGQLAGISLDNVQPLIINSLQTNNTNPI